MVSTRPNFDEMDTYVAGYRRGKGNITHTSNLMNYGPYGWVPMRQRPPSSSINLTLNYARGDSYRDRVSAGLRHSFSLKIIQNDDDHQRSLIGGFLQARPAVVINRMLCKSAGNQRTTRNLFSQISLSIVAEGKIGKLLWEHVHVLCIQYNDQ